MHKVQSIVLLLLCLIGPFGCEQKPNTDTDYRPPSHDAQGFLIQPDEQYLVKGMNDFTGNFFVQFDVDGRDAKPFILCIGPILPHDAWPTTKPKPEESPRSHFAFPETRDPPARPYTAAALSVEQVAMIENAVRKSFIWAQIALKEDIETRSKPLLVFTNEYVILDFTRRRDSTNFSLELSMRSEPLVPNGSPTYWSVMIDERGTERLLSVVTNLHSRRQKYLAFKEADAKSEHQRQEAETKERARANELLR